MLAYPNFGYGISRQGEAPDVLWALGHSSFQNPIAIIQFLHLNCSTPVNGCHGETKTSVDCSSRCIYTVTLFVGLFLFFCIVFHNISDSKTHFVLSRISP